jgi:adhesin transport system outer membrane protein
MRTRVLIPHLPLLFSIFFTGTLGAASLEDTVKETVASSPDVLIAESQRDSVNQEMEQARAGFFPQADITIGTGSETTDSPVTRAASGKHSRGLHRNEAEIFIRQLLYDGKGTVSEFERQRARVNSRAYATFSTAEVTALRAVEVYLDVIREQKLVQLAVTNLENHQTTYDRILKRGKSGVGRRADTQQALGRLALARTNLMAEENNLKDAISAFVNVVGHRPEGLIEPVSRDYLLLETLNETVAAALDNHPQLKSAESDVVAAREQHKAAESLFYPRVHLEIGGTVNDNIDGISGHNNDASIMLRGRYSFTGGKDIARRKETVFQMDEAKEIRDRTRRQVIESIQLSWNAYETTNSQLEFLKIHVDASKLALLAYRKQFNIGKRTLLDVLDQENEVFQARINYVNGLTEVDFSAYRILAGTGRLLWALGVPLPEAANTIQVKR